MNVFHKCTNSNSESTELNEWKAEVSESTRRKTEFLVEKPVISFPSSPSPATDAHTFTPDVPSTRWLGFRRPFEPQFFSFSQTPPFGSCHRSCIGGNGGDGIPVEQPSDRRAALDRAAGAPLPCPGRIHGLQVCSP